MDVPADQERLPVTQVGVHRSIEAAARCSWIDAAINVLREARGILLLPVEEGLVDPVAHRGNRRKQGALILMPKPSKCESFRRSILFDRKIKVSLEW